MQLLSLPASPFVRKVRVAMHELGLADRVEVVHVETSPHNSDPRVTAQNPLGRVPTLIRDDGPPLYESGVICEYLDSLVDAPTLVPMTGERRWASRRLHALADGIAQEGVTLRREASRPVELQWSQVTESFGAKLTRSFDYLEANPDLVEGELDIGQIALATTIAWLVFREVGPPVFDDRTRLTAWYESFAKRESMRATDPSS
jgi:glutathione S-transferase